MLEPLHFRERVAVDLVEPAQLARERMDLAVDALAREILEQIVVGMHSVERGVRRMRLVQITEQVVDEVWKGFGSDHHLKGKCPAAAGRAGSIGTDPPMVQ